MNSPAKDALRLKMAGLIFMALGGVGFAVLGDAIGDGGKLLTGTPRYVALIAGGWMVTAHIFAFGLIVLLAGLKNVPLATSARARRGALRKLAGSTLIILCFAYVGLMDMPAFKFVDEMWWIQVPSLALFLLAARVGFQLLRSGWKYDAVSAEQLLASDPRPPVVYLRSFQADSEVFLRPDGRWSRLMTVFIDYAVTFSPEQELAEILNHVGPVIAIGKPGEPLPELGAARLYVGDADWKAKVTDMLARSRLVIIRTGSTPNLHWEIEETMARVPHRQILFVSFGDARKTAAFDQYFERRFGPVIKSSADPDTPGWMKLISIGHSTGKYVTGKVVCFDASQRPLEIPIRLTFSLTGLALGLMRPYRDSIQSAMKHVFALLELPWVTRTSQTTAVMLAMFGGIFGLHHFYLGDRRRGVRYLAFFWTIIPMFVGWYDTVKLARLGSREFDEKFSPQQAAPELSQPHAAL